MESDSGDEIAYVLTEIPQRPDAFAAEVNRLDSTGVKLHIFWLVHRDDAEVPAGIVSASIALTCVQRQTGISWEMAEGSAPKAVAALAAAHLRVLLRRPRAYLTALASAAVLIWKGGTSRARSFGRKLLEDFLLAGEIAAHILDAGTVRHVHGFDGARTSTRTWLVGRLTGLSFSFVADAPDRDSSELDIDLLEQAIRASRFVAARSDSARRRLAEICPAHGALHTVYRGVDTRYFAPQSGAPVHEAAIILSVGRFAEESGFEYLIAACAQLKAAGRQCLCWLVGPEGPHSKSILRAIETLGVSDVVSTSGAVTQVQLRHLLRHASVFVLPRLESGAGHPDDIPEGLTEALAMGVPIVTTAAGDIPELIEHGTTGILVRERDSKSLARTLQAMLQSGALRRRLAECERQRACRDFDIRRTADRLRALFLDSGEVPIAPPGDIRHGLATIASIGEPSLETEQRPEPSRD